VKFVSDVYGFCVMMLGGVQFTYPPIPSYYPNILDSFENKFAFTYILTCDTIAFIINSTLGV